MGSEVSASSGIVSPYTLWPESTAGDSVAINVVQLLLALNTNSDPDGPIIISDVNTSEYADINDIIIAGIHEYLDDIQRKLNEISSAIYESFFAVELNH